MKNKILFFFLLLKAGTSFSQTVITFPSLDGIIVTADLYLVNDTLPYMILCHQAYASRGEYRETAPKFNKLGYNCIAVDARSGGEINGIKNETTLEATKANKSLQYLDAEQDIVAAIDYAYSKNKKKIILVGSSYSASVVLKIGTTNEKTKAVISFSPDEYFGTKLNLKESIKSFNKPLFVTSAKNESEGVRKLIQDLQPSLIHQFIPIEEGEHGSLALWKKTPNYNEYWIELMLFLKKIK